MQSLSDRFRHWYEYERDCNAKTLAMLDSVPPERRKTPEFERAVSRTAHISAARLMWLQRLGQSSAIPGFFPKVDSLRELTALTNYTEALWVTYLDSLDDQALAQEFEYRATEGIGFRWTIEGILTQMFGHAWYHRGQVAQIVAQLGGQAVDTDYLFWSPDRVALDPQTSS